MAGGSDNYARIAINLLSLINIHSGDSECRLYNNGDVTCDPRDRDDRYIKRYPKLIVEVLSDSTQTFDAGEKFEDYKQLQSLKEYVLISQDTQRVECRRRTASNTWETTRYEAGDRVLLKSIDLELAIAELYGGVDG